MDSLKKRFALLYLRYEIITCTVMFEPWEKLLINFVIWSSICLLTFSSIIFLPNYVSNLIAMFTPDKSEVGFKHIT